MNILFDAGLLLLDATIFAAAVFGYFLVSKLFQSKRRRGLLGGDGIAFLIAGLLFTVFTVSYIEIFSLAFRLPYSAYADLGIGLLAVAAGIAAAYKLFALVSKRRLRLHGSASG